MMIIIYLKEIKNGKIRKVRNILHCPTEHKNSFGNKWKDNEGNYPLLAVINNNSIEMVKLLIKYVNDKKFFLKINEDDKECFPFLYAIIINNAEIVKLLIDYAKSNKNNVKLDTNVKGNDGLYPFLEATDYDCVNNNKIHLEINEKDNEGNYLLLAAIDNNNNNIEIIRLLIWYINNNINNVKLDINDIDENGHNIRKRKGYRKNLFLFFEKWWYKQLRINKERCQLKKKNVSLLINLKNNNYSENNDYNNNEKIKLTENKILEKEKNIKGKYFDSLKIMTLTANS